MKVNEDLRAISEALDPVRFAELALICRVADAAQQAAFHAATEAQREAERLRKIYVSAEAGLAAYVKQARDARFDPQQEGQR